MSPGSDDHLRDLQRRLVDAERRLDRVPARWAQAPPSADTLTAFEGNVLATLAATPVPGIKNGFNILSVPTLAPVYGTTYADGLGYARLNGLASYVWCAATAMGVTDASVSMPYGWITRSLNSVSVPVAGSAPVVYARVYLPWVP